MKFSNKHKIPKNNQDSNEVFDTLKKKLESKEAIRQIKANNKITIKENKRNEKKRKAELFKKRRWFNFFTKWSFLGIIMILLSLCLTTYVQNSSFDFISSLEPLITIISGVLSTVGIALFLGCIFDFSKNSEAFMGFVSDILSDIIVSKEFLSTLSVKDKEQALNLILKPMDAQVEQYANINDFFKKKINESMTMFETNFKANVIMNVEARKDKTTNRVVCDTTLIYTIYKLNNKFEPIEILFEKENSSSSNIKIISPLGEREITQEETPNSYKACGIDYTKFTFVIPEEYEKFDHLTVKRTTTEPGYDHWIHYIWQSLTPYEGISCRLVCYDDLTVKDFMIFDNKAYYHVDKSDDMKRIDITSSQWLDADTGFSFVISE